MIPNWPEYLIGFARHAATKSKDSTQVGAALVGPLGEVRLTGYNGPPQGVEDRPERRERPEKYTWVSHAEMNVIAFAARQGIETAGCTLYVTHQPCSMCSRLIIQAGIKKVVYAAGSFGPGSAMTAEMQTSQTMFAEAGVVCETVESTER